MLVGEQILLKVKASLASAEVSAGAVAKADQQCFTLGLNENNHCLTCLMTRNFVE